MATSELGVTGGRCNSVVMERVDEHGCKWTEYATHHSTTRVMIDASRYVSIYICDRCRGLFVPEVDAVARTKGAP